MKKLKKSALNIDGVVFNIFSSRIEEILKYFEEFITSSNKEVITEYNIFYENDIDLFKRLYKCFNKSECVEIDTFINQKHYKYKNEFMIDNEDYICVKNDEKNYKLFVNGSNIGDKYLIRIIRELLIRTLENSGYFYMHGTGIEIFEKGILILGESGSGKTTFTTKLNEFITTQKFLSNDRVFLKNDEMLYFPLPIVYSMGTVKGCNELNNYFVKTNALKRRNGNYYSASVGTKCDIPLTDISAIFPHIKNVSKLNLDVIIFPKISNGNLSINNLDSKDAINRLNASNYTPIDRESKRKEWLMYRNVSDEIIKKNKKLLNDYLIENKRILEVSFDVQSTNEQIVKELIKRI